jgi:ABC-2 type transport system permease protein
MSLFSGQAVYTIWLREVKRFTRARSRLLATLLQPLFFLTILGFGLNSAVMPGIPAGFQFLDFLAPGMIAMSVLFSSVFAGVSVLWDKQFGFLQEVLVAPVSRLSIVLGRTLGGATTALVQGFIILGIALVFGVKVAFQGLFLAVVFMITIALTAVGFGLIVASQMEDFQGFSNVMNLLVFPLFFTSSAIFPIEGLPGWLKTVVYMNPLTYGVDGLRQSIVGFSSIPIQYDLTVLAAFSALMMTVATYLFGKTEA